MRKSFLDKSYTKYVGETIPRPFSKKSKLSISLNQWYKVLYSLFSLYVQVKDYQDILKPRCGPFGFSLYKAFLKIKRRPGTSFLPQFLRDY